MSLITGTVAVFAYHLKEFPIRSLYRMHLLTTGSALALALVSMTTFIPLEAHAEAHAPLHIQDRAYMIYGIEQDRGLIAFSEMAARKSTDPEVQRIASSTADYHRGSVERLSASAERLGLTPPMALNPVSQETEAYLQELDGTDFDRVFLNSVVIGSYNGTFGARREMKHGFDTVLRAEAERQAEELQSNRRAAQRIAEALPSQPASADGVTFEDRDFLLYAMHIDLAQIGFAEPAAERATDPRVRKLARELVDYHQSSYDELVDLATAKGIEPLREISGISSGTQDRIAALETSQALDWAFLNAHAFTSFGAHYRYEREAIHGGDTEIMAIAERAAAESRRQHWRALRIMNDWTWEAEVDS